MEYQNYITINSDIRFGKPCLVNTRVSVFDVLGWLASGMTTIEIIEDFPQLSKDAVMVCLACAADKK